MGLSYATIDATKMELTPMKVLFKGPSDLAAVDLGGTLSNIVVDMKYEKAEIKADQMGTTVLDRRVKGLVVSVTTELTEIQNKDLWKVIFPHATKVVSGTDVAIDFKSMVGDGDLSNAGELTLHPLSKDATDVDYDYTFFKCCASAESSVTYGPDNQARMKIVWNVLPDTSVSPARFFRFGDKALV